MYEIKVTRTYTLPRNREGRGVVLVVSEKYDPDLYDSPIEWAGEALQCVDCTRHNWGNQFVKEEPTITDYSRGEEMTAIAELMGFTQDELIEVIQSMAG
jgi:hypothetical protein